MKKVVSFFSFLLIVVVAAAQEAPEGLFLSSKAPDFRAKDQNGEEVRLKDLLKKGKVVLVFYRGQWCPYCNKELSRLQDSLQLIKDKGASLIAVSPELPENIDSTVKKTKAEYPVLYDEGMKIMKAYDVEFQVQENVLTRFEKLNGKNGKFLPVPAVYIIDKEQTVIYRFFEQDYKKRPSVKEILEVLDKN
jgi:peroxiredoxin